MSNDLINDCMTDLQTNDQSAFIETFCQRCRQPECMRSQWSTDKFGSRVATQAARLLRPIKADNTSSRYEHLTDFPSMFQEAMKLEIADRRGDWSVPDLSTFGKIPNGQGSMLKDQKNIILDPMGDDPALEDMSVDDDIEEPEDEYLEDEVEEPEAPVPTAVQGKPATVVASPSVGAAQVGRGNIPKPAGGVMIGDDKAQGRVPVYADPWAAPPVNTQKVQPGATIKLEK